MKTIGNILKDARVSKNLSLKQIEDITKIKPAFISAIEVNDWDALPAFPTVLGFVKSLSTTLEIDDSMTVAILKRDYPPKKLNVVPKPDVSNKFIWSPRLTFILGTGLVLLILLGYLAFQYIHFVSPPNLKVESPKEGQVVMGGSINVFGVTDTDTKITVNGQPIVVSDDGKFSVNLDVVTETKEIVIKSSSRSGKETEIHRTIQVE